MTPSLKHLHDALFIISNQRKAAEQLVQCTLTDINDSDENFERRGSNLADQVEEITNQIDKLTRSRDVILKEYDRMTAARESGHEAVNDLRRQIKKLDLAERSITLAILQQEVDR